MSVEEDYLYLDAPNILDKYNKLIKAGMLFMVLGVIMMVGAFLYYESRGVYDKDTQDLRQMLPFLLTIVPVYGATLIRQAISGKKELFRAAMNGLLFDHQGIKGPVALLEGPIATRLKDDMKQNKFHITWDEIKEFIVEPVRGKRGDAPPYYKIPLKGGDGSMHSCYFILREHFKGSEDKIMDYIKKYLGDDQIILNDELVTSKTGQS